MRIDLKLLLGAKEGSGLGKVLMKKPKTTGTSRGPRQSAGFRTLRRAFTSACAEGRGIEDLVLIALEKKQDRRFIRDGR